jgi:UDP-glucose:glycoprotein glucosyltransferase
VHHAVFVLDLTSKEDLTRLVDEIAGLIKRQIPIRFGVVALPTEGDVTSETLARIFYHLIDSYGRAVAMQFGEALLQSYDPATLSKTIETLYTAIFDKTTINAGHEKIPYKDLADPSSSDLVAKTRAWANRLGINPDDGAIFGNGQVFVKDDTWINKLGSQLHEDLLSIQKAVYSNEIAEYDDILDFFFRGAPKRRNQYVFPADSADVKFINLAGPLVEKGIVYIRREIEDEEGVDTATVVWIVDDFDSITGVELIRAVSTLQSAHPYIAIGLMHNPGPTTGPPNLSLLLYHLASNGLFEDPAGIERFHQLLQEVDFSGRKTADEMEKILGIKAGSWRTIDNELARQFWDSGRNFAEAAGFGPGKRGIVINGRVRVPKGCADERLLAQFKIKIPSVPRTLKLYTAMNRLRELGLQFWLP